MDQKKFLTAIRYDALPFIIDLLHDKIRTLVKVSQPKTFNELRQVVRKLEKEH